MGTTLTTKRPKAAEAALAFFAGKKATQIGLGLLGRGVRDADFLARHCAHLIVTDKKDAEALATSVALLEQYSNISFTLGTHKLEDFEDRDFVLKGAGVPLDSVEVERARERGIPIYMDEALFALLRPDCPMVGITGTRGKTTTTMLLHHIVSTVRRAHLCGNIKDVATLPMVETAEEGDTMIAELSSWQLQGFDDVGLSPKIAVFTNFMPDHLNYYADDMALYFKDKSYIFSSQSAEDTLICTEQAWAEIQARYKGEILSKVIIARPEDFADIIAASPLPGEHNARNIACAAAAARVLGIDDATMIAAVKTFAGAPGRLELAFERDGIRVYNDTTSTTPEALMAAVGALKSSAHTTMGDERRVVLIMGGADKGLDFEATYEPIASMAKAVIMTPGNGTTRIAPDLERACADKGVPFTIAASTADAVLLAKERLVPGDALLFSPGFASFAEFKNEFDRGERFMEFVTQVFIQS